MTLLVENIMTWIRRMAKSLSAFEDLDDVESPQEILPFFEQLRDTIDKFFTQANEEMTSAKLWKLTSTARSKEYAEQQKLLSDKDFLRVNCRVPASLDAGQRPNSAGHHR